MIRLPVPFYVQTTEFTCDPACVMMALKFFRPETILTRKLEFDIWRDAYGIGIPGCMPQGMACSAIDMGLGATLICRKSVINKISRKIAHGENRTIAVETSKYFLKEAIKKGMKFINRKPLLEDVENAILHGNIPVIMINMKKMHDIDSPHWIVVTGFDVKNFYVNDPYSSRPGKIARKDLEDVMIDLERLNHMEKRVLIISKQV